MFFWLPHPKIVISVAFFVIISKAKSDKHQGAIPNLNVFSATEYYNISGKPVLANGHVGFVPYSDWIFMNGVYNGFKGNSHRARIPNYANIYIESCGPSKDPDVNCQYALDVQRAVFEMRAIFDDGNFLVRQTQYAHRYYDSVIVNTIQLRRKSLSSNGEFDLKRLQMS